MKKKTVYFLIALFIISFTIRIIYATYSPIKYWDETIYSNLGRNILIYGEYSFQHGFADFSPNWPLAGFRPPLLPIIIGIISFFSFSTTALNLIIPIISSIGAIGFFLLIKELFNKKIATSASLIFILLPMNVFWGSKILTDTLFLTMIIFSTYFFYLSFFKNKKPIMTGILFGIFTALSFLSRYSLIWFIPFFFIALLIKYKNLKFLKEKKLWIAIFSFTIIISPWIIYNYIKYGTLLGFLTQAKEASLRWGTQSYTFYIKSFLKDFYLLIPFFIIGLFQQKNKQSKYFMILWLVITFLSASLMGHKESRYLLPIVPAICAISAVGISRIKKYSKIILIILLLLLLSNNYINFMPSYYQHKYDANDCFLNTMNFMKSSNASYIVTEHFSPVYFHTKIQNIRVNNYTIIKSRLEKEHQNQIIYYYYVNGDWFDLQNEANIGDPIYSCEDFNVFNIFPE